MDNANPLSRCARVGSDPLYRGYHDREWGVPIRDDRLLFEFLTLEGAQAFLKIQEEYCRLLIVDKELSLP